VSGPVVVLAGGTGGAKLARGMADVAGDLVVIANTGDDIEIYGAHVSPDPDLVTYWLADRIDERGWGLRDDTFAVMDGLRELGVDVWFNLGDRDLAVCLRRADVLAHDGRLTDALRELTGALGVSATVLPMSDEPVRTRVKADGRWWPVQDYLIRRGWEGEVEGVEYDGIAEARPTAEALDALARAEAIVIGPSNPGISIGPILAVPGMADALSAAPAAVVALSPIVGGQSVKGPTEAFMRHAGQPLSAVGIAELYAGVIDGVVTDEDVELPVAALRTDTLMADAESRARVARETLEFARALASSP
jgi:LPPG:FO 2-phospho-L-lactate transferase